MGSICSRLIGWLRYRTYARVQTKRAETNLNVQTKMKEFKAEYQKRVDAATELMRSAKASGDEVLMLSERQHRKASASECQAVSELNRIYTTNRRVARQATKSIRSIEKNMQRAADTAENMRMLEFYESLGKDFAKLHDAKLTPADLNKRTQNVARQMSSADDKLSIINEGVATMQDVMMSGDENEDEDDEESVDVADVYSMSIFSDRKHSEERVVESMMRDFDQSISEIERTSKKPLLNKELPSNLV